MTLKTLLATATSPGGGALHAGPEVVTGPGAEPEVFPSWYEGRCAKGKRGGGVTLFGLWASGRQRRHDARPGRHLGRPGAGAGTVPGVVLITLLNSVRSITQTPKALWWIITARPSSDCC